MHIIVGTDVVGGAGQVPNRAIRKAEAGEVIAVAGRVPKPRRVQGSVEAPVGHRSASQLDSVIAIWAADAHPDLAFRNQRIVEVDTPAQLVIEEITFALNIVIGVGGWRQVGAEAAVGSLDGDIEPVVA